MAFYLICFEPNECHFYDDIEANHALICVFFRQQQGGGGSHDAGVVYVGQQEERSHPQTEPALPAVCILSSS